MKKTNDRSDYEVKQGLVARGDLMSNVLGMFDELSETDFHRMYDLLWSMASHSNDRKHAAFWENFWERRSERKIEELQAQFQAKIEEQHKKIIALETVAIVLTDSKQNKEGGK